MNKRQTDILRILYKNPNFITLGELAKKVGVSVKTVRNDIAVIREELSKAEAGTVEAKPHIGVRLVSGKKDLNDLAGSGDDADREIIFFIIRHLFKESTLTAQRLAQQYYLPRTQLEKILEQVSNWFFENRIVFERRRGKGISISFSEFNFREAFFSFYSDFSDMYSELITERNSAYPIIADKDFTAMSAALGGFDAAPVAHIVTELEEQFGLRFNYSFGVRLVFMLSLFVLRARKGVSVELPKTCKSAVDGTSDSEMAEIIVDKLRCGFGIEVLQQETEYIVFLIAVSEIQEFETEESRRSFETKNAELCRLTVKTVSLISEIAGVNLRGDKFFVHQMFLQLKITAMRLKYGITWKNRLLSQIKAKYPNMMAVAWLLGNVFEKELMLEINEHEVGFLALLIGGAIERHQSALSACIVCDYGVGISQILCEKIRRTIPELRITGVFSVRDMRRIKSEQCDFIIAATPLEAYRLNRSIVEIEHLLDERDVQAIEEQMKKLHLKQKTSLSEIVPKQSIFSSELIFTQQEAADKNSLLSELCSKLERLGYVTQKFKKSVFEREETTSTGIGNGFAVPHGLSEYVNRSTAVFVSLKEPIEWNGSETADIIILLAFDLDESETVKKEIVGFYKALVTFMEDSEKCKLLRELNDKNEIIKILEQR